MEWDYRFHRPADNPPDRNGVLPAAVAAPAHTAASVPAAEADRIHHRHTAVPAAAVVAENRGIRLNSPLWDIPDNNRPAVSAAEEEQDGTEQAAGAADTAAAVPAADTVPVAHNRPDSAVSKG